MDLYSLLRDRSLEPTTKLISLGLENHTPVDALNSLLEDPEAMSVALHEATHFHSLTNNIGAALTAKGFFVYMSADYIVASLQQQSGDLDFFAWLYNMCFNYYTYMLEAWRPLLEGIAVYSQVAFPWEEPDSIYISERSIANARSFRAMGLALVSLSPHLLDVGRSGRVRNMDDLTLGFHSAALRAMQLSPSMSVEKRSLAEWLEKDRSDFSLPYFLGYAYLKRVQQELMAKEAQFENPEVFLSFLLRLLRNSANYFLDSDATWVQEADLTRLYYWPIVFGAAPKREVAELLVMDRRTDYMDWLTGGEPIIREPQEIIPMIEATLPFQWTQFKDQEYFAEALSGVWSQANKLNFSSGGTCRIVGYVKPTGNYDRCLLVEVSGHLWWMAAEERVLETLGLSLGDMRHFDSEVEDEAVVQQTSDIACPILDLSSFVDYVGYGLPDSTLPRALFEFRDPARSTGGGSLLCFVTPGPGRGILSPVPLQPTQGLHNVGERTRSGIREELAKRPILANWLEKNGHPKAAATTRKAMAEVRQGLSWQRQWWSKTILRGLLGSSWTEAIGNALVEDRLNQWLPDEEGLNHILREAYSAPVKLTGPNAKHWDERLSEINEAAMAALGKPLFYIDDERRVRYLGLWG
jgi:hypothetical protein